jgi:small subunit ribosomal protein S20
LILRPFGAILAADYWLFSSPCLVFRAVIPRLLFFKAYFGGKTLANHKSAEKRARQAVKRNARNTATEKSVRTWEKKLRKAVSDKDKKAAAELLSNYMSKMGKASAKGVITKQTAARKVSRLSTLVSTLGA